MGRGYESLSSWPSARKYANRTKILRVQEDHLEALTIIHRAASMIDLKANQTRLQWAFEQWRLGTLNQIFTLNASRPNSSGGGAPMIGSRG